MHKNSILVFDAHVKRYVEEARQVLEIGPDEIPSTFRQRIANKSQEWHTLDMDPAKKTTLMATSEYSFPVKDNAYDVILSANVLEHVRKIWVWVKELSRVCKVGGYVITIVPASWPFHEYPYDCWRIFPEGMKALYEDAGLKMIYCGCENRELMEYGLATGPVQLPDVEARSEVLKYKKIHPGIGLWGSKFKVGLKTKLGWPLAAAFDTVAIGQKVSV